MTGGVLQLSLSGYQDLYLTTSPSITFFKSVFRRHSNFSRTELNLNFSNKMNFGKEGYVRIENYGDLLHRLWLNIHLPTISLKFRPLTIYEVQILLQSYGIDWETTKTNNELFTASDYCSQTSSDGSCLSGVKKLIDDKVTEINNELRIVNIYLSRLEGSLRYDAWLARNPRYNDKILINGVSDAATKYLDEIITNFFDQDKFNLEYKIVDAEYKDIVDYYSIINPDPSQLPLANSQQIQTLMLNEFIKYAISNRIYPPTLPVEYNDDNLAFLYNVDTANYATSGSVDTLDSNTVFRTALAAVYGSDIFYTQLDAYKIFDYILNNNSTNISGQSDVQNLKTIIMNNITYGLLKNVKILNNIYTSLVPDSRFILYRKFPVLTVGSGTYDTSATFVYQSMLSNLPALMNDNYTNDFVLAPEPGEPSTINHPLSAYIQSNVNNFHSSVRDSFRDSKLNSYFNQITQLWSRFDIYQNPNNPATLSFIPAPNSYWLNYVWFGMNEDIPDSINTYLQTPAKSFGLNFITIGQLYNALRTARDNIYSVIHPKITYTGDPIGYTNYDVLRDFESSVKTNVGVTGDIVLSAIIRPGSNNSLVQLSDTQYVTIPEYITMIYNDVLDNFALTLTGDQQTRYNTALPFLHDIVGLYTTDYPNIPTYATYANQTNNIYPDPLKQINSTTQIYSDVQSSIWNYLFNNWIRLYNNLYNNVALGYAFYTNNVGVELLSYIVNISRNYLDYNLTDSSFFDYFRNVENYYPLLPTQSPGTIETYINSKVIEFQSYLNFYNSNRKLLDMKNIQVSRPIYFYEQFNDVVDYITNIIETTRDSNGNLVYNHLYHPTAANPNPPFPDIVRLVSEELHDKSNQYNELRNNAMDVVLKIDDVVNTFFNTFPNPNPYNATTEPTKYALYNATSTLVFDPTIEKLKYNDQETTDDSTTLFNWLYREFPTPQLGSGASNLYQYNLQIDINYNSFANEGDVYKFMKDYIIQRSILKDLPSLAIGFVFDVWFAANAYYTGRKLFLTDQLAKINGTNGDISLYSLLERSLNTDLNAKFAWVRKIGHYIIKTLTFKIDDQIIDRQYGEWMEVWHSLTRINKKEPGYDKMIGNVSELYTFDNKDKPSFEMLIPLQFWFCRNAGLALPLSALHNTDIKLYINLAQFKEICYYDSFTIFKKTPRLKCNMIAEYIFVEDDERRRLATTKLEYLIDVIQTTGDTHITSTNVNEDGLINITTQFQNPSRELFWVMQNLSFLDGSLTNGELRPDLYSSDTNGQYNPIHSARIKFNARDRELIKPSIVYNYIYPYERHTASGNIGINVYSFSLDPEGYQPSGSANMSRIDDTSIEFVPASNIDLTTSSFRFRIYNMSQQLLRIMSGIGANVWNY